MPKNVLFLCEDNASKSLIAEAIVNASGSRHVKAYSAGLKPAPFADPDAMHVISQAGLRARGLRPKSIRQLTDHPGMHFDYAVHLGEDRPDLEGLVAGDRLYHWPLSSFAGGLNLGRAQKDHYIEMLAEIRQLAESTLLRPVELGWSGTGQRYLVRPGIDCRETI